MIYKFDKFTLEFKKIAVKRIAVKTLIIFILCVVGVISLINFEKKQLTESEVKVILLKQNEFTNKKLISVLGSMNFKFPYIIYAQAIHETNDFKSNIFKENNNLFGMKVAVSRPTKAKGEQNGHAYYDNWIESVDDYAIYCGTYLNDIKTEDDYFNYLSQYYAEDKKYVSKLKIIIDSLRLKSLFKIN